MTYYRQADAVTADLTGFYVVKPHHIYATRYHIQSTLSPNYLIEEVTGRSSSCSKMRGGHKRQLKALRSWSHCQRDTEETMPHRVPT